MTNEIATTEVTAAEVPAVAIRSLIFPRGGLQEYQRALIQEAHQRVVVTEAQLDEADAGIMAAADAEEERQERQWRLRKARRLREVARAKRFEEAILEGYLPIPRLPAVRLEWTQQVLPPEALEILSEAKTAGLFDEFRVVDGQDAYPGGFPRGRQAAKRDPILVGLIGDELFPLFWWRPQRRS